MAGNRIVTLVFLSALMAFTVAEKVEFNYTLVQSGTICFLENVGENVNGKCSLYTMTIKR